MEKFEIFKNDLLKVLNYFDKYLIWEVKMEEEKEANDNDIESYF